MSDSQQSNGLNLAHIFEEYWVLMFFGCIFTMMMFLPILLIGLGEAVPPIWLQGGFGVAMLAAVTILGFGLCKTCCKNKKC